MTVEEEVIRNKSGQVDRTKNAVNSAKSRSTLLSTQIPLLHNIFEEIPEAILFTDDKGHIQYMNKAAVSMLGRQKEFLEPEDWPQKFGLYLDDVMVQYPGQKLPLMRALQGEIISEEHMILRI